MGSFRVMNKLFCLFLFFLFYVQLSFAGENDEDRVLVINGYTESYIWFNAAYNGIIDHLGEVGRSEKVTTQPLNMQLFNSQEDVDARKRRILEPYDEEEPNAIVLLGNSAFILFREELEGRWRDIPVVLCADNDNVSSIEACISKQDLDPQKEEPLAEAVKGMNLTIVKCPIYVEQTVKTMKELLPEMERLVLISDRRYVCAQVRHEVEEVVTRKFPDIKVSHLTNGSFTMDQVLDSIRSYDHTTGILYYSWIQVNEQLGNSYIYANNYKIMTGLASNPIFSLMDVNIHSGEMAGGCFYLGKDLGRTMGQVVEEVLKGRKPTDIPWINVGPAETWLCYNVLHMSGIPDSRYPDDAVYLFAPPTFLEQYWGILLFSISAVLVFFYWNSTKHRKKEMALFGKYKMLFNNMPIAYFKHRLLKDEKGNVTGYVVEDANALYSNSLLGQRNPVGSQGNSSDPGFEEYLKMYQEVLRCNKPYSFEYHLKANNSYYEFKVTPASEPDVVDVYAIETTKLHNTQALVESINHKLAMALDVANIVPWKWDLVRHTILCDVKRPLEIQSEEPQNVEEALSVPERDYFSKIHKDDRQRVEQAYANLIQGNVKKVREEYRVLYREDNHTNFEWVEAQATIDARDEIGRPLTLVGSSVVITRRKKMELELLSAKNRAEESNRLKSAFLANMSHEIRTPLNAIVGFSNILSSTDKLEEKQEYVAIIENNNTLLLQLINDILDISKIEAGTLEFIYTDFNVNDMMYELEQTFRLRVKDKPIEIICEISLPFCHIHSEKNRLMQVLINMLTNAVKFTEQGSISLGYREQQDGMLYFYVTDTGCGIPQDKKEMVFGRFIKLNSFQQGTGLGLSICETIVNKLGGRIGVDSVEGSGSRFWFTIPYNPVSIDPSQQAAEKNLLLSERRVVEQSKLKILIAEDTDSNYRLFETILMKDYQLLHARNGQEAVEMFREHEPHLILMDINMPVMNGYEAVEQIRKLSTVVPIIAVTAYAFEQDEQKILHSGFDAYTSKPINATMLKGKITTLLARSLILI